MSGTARVLRLQTPAQSGADVLRVQRRLIEIGFESGQPADGYYGAQTVRAVQMFQNANGLPMDGIAGPGTLARLFPPSARVAAASRPLLRYRLPLMRGDDVLLLQGRLRALGHTLAGGIDGVFDASTAAAVRAFQAASGLAADAIAGPSTWQALMASAQPPAPAPARAVPATPAAWASAAGAASSGGVALVMADDEFAKINAWHSRFNDGSLWMLRHDGVAIDRAAPVGSGGDPATARRIWRAYRAELEAAATEFHVPVELLVATIATESSGKADATRLEPGYTSDAATPHRVSVGLTQTLISTAREALHDPAVDRKFLLQPLGAIRAGAAYIARQRKTTSYDPPLVACAYNAGSIRENASAHNRWRMLQYPIGTSAHADRFVEFFNDCLHVFDEGVPDAPHFKTFLKLRLRP